LRKGAWHNSSAWDHSHLCCSDDCGEALGKKLDKFYKSKKYKKLQKAVNEADSNLAKACYKATGVECRGGLECI